jgi:hypothetical protein
MLLYRKPQNNIYYRYKNETVDHNDTITRASNFVFFTGINSGERSIIFLNNFIDNFGLV